MDVVVPSLTGDGGRFRGGMGGFVDSRRVFILGCITLKKPFNFLVVAVLKGSFLGG